MAPRAGFETYSFSIPIGYFSSLRSKSISIGLRILSNVTFSHVLPRSQKIKNHTCVWLKILTAPRAGFEPATNRLHVSYHY